MHPNHKFVLHHSRGTILDYGCGSGEVVRAGLARGLDIYGVEAFYQGAHGLREQVGELLGTRIRELRDGIIPFPDASFDTVVNNQVFEHVEDLDAVLREIHRVLKPGGQLLSLFPSREVIREGHCGVPLAHRFAGTNFGYRWLLTFRKAGLGYNKNGKAPEQWAHDFNHWLVTYCSYRAKRDIALAFERAGFVTEHRERDYVRFRWRAPLMPAWMFQRLGFMVLSSVMKLRAADRPDTPNPG